MGGCLCRSAFLSIRAVFVVFSGARANSSPYSFWKSSAVTFDMFILYEAGASLNKNGYFLFAYGCHYFVGIFHFLGYEYTRWRLYHLVGFVYTAACL